MGHNTLEERYRSLNLLGCEETNDANLGQPAIVELLDQTGGLRFFGLVLVEAEGIVETSDWDRVWDQLLGLVEAGELPGLATTHVVRTSCLGKPLEEANEEDDLPLGSVGESIPLLRWATSGSTDATTDGGPRECDAVRLDNVANEGCHGTANSIRHIYLNLYVEKIQLNNDLSLSLSLVIQLLFIIYEFPIYYSVTICHL